MVLRLFGLKKTKKDESPTGAEAAPRSSSTKEPLAFEEIAGAPAAASPPQTETVHAQVGAAKALRATRARNATRPKAAKPSKKGKTGKKPTKAKAASKLSKKQLAQRKYAGQMRTVRKRATKASGGKGRIANRSGATSLRRKLGLKAGKK